MILDSFLLATNDDLTDEFSGEFLDIFQADFSDNPHVHTLWFGSLTSNRAVKAPSNPGTDHIFLTPTDTLEVWTAATVVAEGDAIQPTVSNTYRYICTTSGTTHASVEPTFPTTIGDDVTDNGVVWECVSKKSPITEIKLALTEEDLETAVAGEALDMGTVINSEAENAVPIWIEFTNSVAAVLNTGTQPDVKLYFSLIREYDV